MRWQREPHDSATLTRYSSSTGDENRLFQHTTTYDQGANLLATNEDRFALLMPHDDVAEDWQLAARSEIDHVSVPI